MRVVSRKFLKRKKPSFHGKFYEMFAYFWTLMTEQAKIMIKTSEKQHFYGRIYVIKRPILWVEKRNEESGTSLISGDNETALKSRITREPAIDGSEPICVTITNHTCGQKCIEACENKYTSRSTTY